MKETAIQRAIQNYALYQGALVWRINSGGRETRYTTKAGQKKRSWFWFSKWQTLGRDEETSGGADLIILFPSALWVVVEGKRPGGELRPKQVEFRDEILARGGEWVKPESTDEFIAWAREKGLDKSVWD